MKFQSYVFEDSINSRVVQACFDEFAKQLCKKTVIILDNASIHKSDEFKQNIELWEKQGLFIYFLPPYSPELNRIENLWRFIKYYWLSPSAYKGISSLREHLYEVLKNIGSKYQINFV
jgi:transposase